MTLSDTISVVPDQVSCGLAAETAILHVKSGIYYTLDPVGTRIWNLIQQPASIAVIRDTIVSEYDVTTDRCEADLFRLLDDLQREALIQVHTS